LLHGERVKLAVRVSEALQDRVAPTLSLAARCIDDLLDAHPLLVGHSLKLVCRGACRGLQRQQSGLDRSHSLRLRQLFGANLKFVYAGFEDFWHRTEAGKLGDLIAPLKLSPRSGRTGQTKGRAWRPPDFR